MVRERRRHGYVKKENVVEPNAVASNDPRWDQVGFEAWTEENKVTWFKVGALRCASRDGQSLEDVAALTDCDVMHIGAPPLDTRQAGEGR